ncbi:hypothetical protein WJU23_08725 [Prosthecobacter sp. SYSU 5D2]|uniref:hypothetical protein n=1 Tax=Prosthecobacter sp. SYSU 5D2 TaxID=3134134 RepID=UPI0031FE9F91
MPALRPQCSEGILPCGIRALPASGDQPADSKAGPAEPSAYGACGSIILRLTALRSSAVFACLAAGS